MSEDSLDFNEEEEVRKGGEEVDPNLAPEDEDEAAAAQKAKDPNTLATPTELRGGGTSNGPDVHGGGTPVEY